MNTPARHTPHTARHALLPALLPVMLLILQPLTATAQDTAQDTAPKVDVAEIVMGHVQDDYQWHITTWGDTHLTLPLPVLLWSKETGFRAFLSDRLYPAGTIHEGFRIATGGPHAGKIVAADGTRPLDLSVTKTVLGLLINSLVVMAAVLTASRHYRHRKPEDEAPRGWAGLMEMLVTMLEDDIIKPCVGDDYRRFSPYLLTAFFFIFVNNLMGLVPVFPGGANVTGNIAVTLTLALCTFVAVNVCGTRGYWKEILWPDVPLWLKCPLPLMPFIELFGIFTKPFALTIRLFANILAGHFIILALTSIIFVTAAMGPLVNGPMTLLSVAFSIFMNCLELLVAFLQAYVFTMLSAVFIGMSRVKPHPKTINHKP